MWDPYAEFETATLPNGLTVHAAHWPERPWEAVGFVVHSGAEHDPVGREGTAHFVEHLVSRNVAKMSNGKIKKFFQYHGGEVDLGGTGHQSTRYSFFVPAQDKILLKTFDIFGRMLFLAQLKKCLESERPVIISEINRRYQMKFELEWQKREGRMLFPGLWLERQYFSFGNVESVERLEQDELQEYYNKHYTPANISLVGVGGVSLTKLIGLLSESPLVVFKKGYRTPLPEPTTVSNRPLENRYVFNLAESVNFGVDSGSYRSVAIIPGCVDDATFAVLSEMLNKALFEAVRKRRSWAYDPNCFSCNMIYFRNFYIACSGLSLAVLDRIEEVIDKCISSLAGRKDLFKQVKQARLAKLCLITDLSDRSLRNDAMSDLADYQRIVTLAEMIEKTKRVTSDDVSRALYWLGPEFRWTRIVRP